MIEPERWAEVHRLVRLEGYSHRAVGRRLCMDPKTVRRILSQECYPGAQPIRRKRGSILDPLKPYIRRYLDEHPELSAVQILERLKQEHGFGGKITVVRRFVRSLREKKLRAYLTLTFLPGECAQVDWGHFGQVEIGGTRRRVSLFAMVLAHSRLLYVELTLSERMDAFLEAHDRAFRFFRGVPKRVLYDNCKTVVLQRVGGAVRFHPRLLEFAAHHLFRASACPPRRPWHKGIVESSIGYVRKSFRAGRGLVEDLERARRELADWRDRVANRRDHKTTRRKPAELFAEVERDALLPLPAKPYDTAHIDPSVSANKSYRVHFDGNRYSVPFQLSRERGLVLKATSRHVEIYHQGECVARHPRSYARGVDVYDEQHDRGLRERKRRDDRDLLLGRFISIFGQEAKAYAAGLAKSYVRAAHHVRRILSMTDRFGVEELKASMAHTARFGAFGADYVENAVQQARRRRLLRPTMPPPAVRDEALSQITVPEPDLTRLDHLFHKGEHRAQDKGLKDKGEAEGRRKQRPPRSPTSQPQLPWPDKDC